MQHKASDLGAFDVDAMLSPVGFDAFLSTHWERQHLLLRRGLSDYYRPLITAADLENIISNADGRYPAIRLAKGGGYYSPEAYTRDIKQGDESFLGVADVRRITEEYRRGATVALPGIHRTWRPLGLLCDALQARFDHPAHANVYITPGNAAGFTPQYDVHEVFVLQIAGKKRWSIYAPVIELPHRSQLFTPQAYRGQPAIMEIDLEAGDTLYLPRGFLHSTTTSEVFSAHVTIGITVYTWVDLVKEFLASAVEDPQLRRALPPGFATRAELKSSLQQGLAAAVEKLSQQTDATRLIESFTERVRKAHGTRPPPFRADVLVIDLETRLTASPPDGYQLHVDGDKTVFEFNGVRYQVTAPVADTLRAMARETTFRASSLQSPLDPGSRLALVQHLHDIGFLKAAAR
jgi:ribosomal protein L16 Arg81 hydroxylase